jgi:hypothetical protein
MAARTVTAAEVLELDLKPSGGQAIILEPLS